METFKISDEYIQLNQLLKALGWCENGAEANNAIDAGEVKVNGVVESRKRNKIKTGFEVEYQKRKVMIE